MPCVHCCKCGFFTVYHSVSGQYLELDDDYREYGRVGPRHVHPTNSVFVVSGVPMCFVDAQDLEAPDDSEASVVAVGHKPRDCGEFVKYQRGLSPKEHREMRLVDEFRTINQEWHNQEIQLRRDDQERAERKADRRHLHTLVIAVVAALLSGVLSGALSSSIFGPMLVRQLQSANVPPKP